MYKLVINKHRTQIKKFISLLPESFTQNGMAIEENRNIIKIIDWEGLKLNVKAFKKPHILNQFVYTTFRKSKAERSYIHAQMLEDKGINTPTPLAYMEEVKTKLLKNSMYISIHEDFDGDMRLLREANLEDSKDLIKQFARFTAKLHDRGILHLDYSSGNILRKKEGDKYIFSLVDLNRMKFDQDITEKDAAYNFRRLWGSDSMIQYFAEKYAQARRMDVDTTLASVMLERKRFWKKFNRKYPDTSPYIG